MADARPASDVRRRRSAHRGLSQTEKAVVDSFQDSLTEESYLGALNPTSLQWSRVDEREGEEEEGWGGRGGEENELADRAVAAVSEHEWEEIPRGMLQGRWQNVSLSSSSTTATPSPCPSIRSSFPSSCPSSCLLNSPSPCPDHANRCASNADWRVYADRSRPPPSLPWSKGKVAGGGMTPRIGETPAEATAAAAGPEGVLLVAPNAGAGSCAKEDGREEEEEERRVDEKDHDHAGKPRDHHHAPATSAAGPAATSVGGTGGGQSAAPAVGPPGFSFPASAATSSACKTNGHRLDIAAGVHPSSSNVHPPSPLTQQQASVASEPTAAGAMQAAGSAEPVPPRPHSVATQSPVPPLPPVASAAEAAVGSSMSGGVATVRGATVGIGAVGGGTAAIGSGAQQAHQAQQRHQEEVQRMVAAKRAAVQRARQMGATGL
ncbi:unnamed protein product [Closterium sp. NIES-64]|nr:unnamed protein product [Closterium sp. NIES-64]